MPREEATIATLGISDSSLQAGLTLHRDRPLGAVVVGRAGMDLYPIPDGGPITSATEFASDVGGAAGNIAVAIARQGVPSALVAPLSDDAIGGFVRTRLAMFGVDTSHCRSIGGDHRTSLAIAETRPNRPDVVIYRNGAADFQLEAFDLKESLLSSASTLVVTGTALAAEPSRSDVMAALVAAKKTETFTILDLDHRSYSWPSPKAAGEGYAAAGGLCDAVIGNIEEFALVAGDETSVEATVAQFVNDGSTFAVLKKGAAGSRTFKAGGHFDTGAFLVNAMKPFGAGDAFIGTTVAALVRGEALSTAVTRGTAAAALVVSRRGCASAMPNSEEVEALIASRDIEQA